MPFREILKELIDDSGCAQGSASAIMSTDGLVVQLYPVDNSPLDMETVGVEYGGALSEIRKATDILRLGDVDEIVISTPGSDVIIRTVTHEYFIITAVARGANLGKARYLTRRAAVKARKEI